MKAILFLSCLVLLGCADGKQPGKETTAPAQEAVNAPRNDFALWSDGNEIPLRAWNTTAQLDNRLGVPDTVSSKTLGEGADTHLGATIKTTFYKGVVIDWYYPKGKDSGWIMQMTVSGNAFETARGVAVGDDAAKVKQLYPEGSVFPDGRKHDQEYAWFISKDNDFLKFEITGEIVSLIEVYHEIP